MEEREGVVERPPVDVGRKESGEDGRSLRVGGDEGCGAVNGGGTETSAADFYR